MNYDNSNLENQLVKSEYKLSATGILQVSSETMRHILNSVQGRDNLITAKSAATLALQNAASFILGIENSTKDGKIEIEAISGTGISINASFKSTNINESKSKLFFAVAVAASNLIEAYDKDGNISLQNITTDFKKATPAYIKSTYLTPQNPSVQTSTPKPIPYKYVETPKPAWRDKNLDNWKNPYSTQEAETQKPYDDWKNPYEQDKRLDTNLEEWKNPYKNEPVLESNAYANNPLDEQIYPKDELDSSKIKINFLDPLAEYLGSSEIVLSASSLVEGTIRGLKQAILRQYPQWHSKLDSANLMFSVNRQVSMSEFDSVSGGSAVTIFIAG